ncbi:MAG: UDP-N-acetylmuramoyl-L-alanyl-D-glutamate--2,6-diaminopimelate ligase [Syntrophorhabdus sp. PtaB.Bin006]|nr:MAG: UDP-N-acetylmuramoyl-L-alanyl-D-glutamate--2,6-diaminopimelate ligase [Syntrophorhabdus sp. PtaB.Bin006]
MKLLDLTKGMPVSHVRGDVNVEITGLTKDSRAVKDGTVFFATRKSETFIAEALKKGATVIVAGKDVKETAPCLIVSDDVPSLLGKMASRFYGLPSTKLHVAGVTGTNGKTTTTYLIESILKADNRKAGVIGTISYRYGGLELKADNTTPGATEAHSLLKDMYESEVRFVAMEVSSHALDQKRVEGIEFDIGIFTNLTHDHLDYHGDLDNYKSAKALLFRRYLEESAKENRCAILNADDPVVRDMIPSQPVKSLFYSLKTPADGHLVNSQENIRGLKLELSVMGKAISIHSPLVGLFNASNILASALYGYTVGVPLPSIKRGVEGLGGVPGRLERVMNEDGASIFVDYAHTPDALKKVLEMLNRLKEGRLILVFGCGGDRDRTKRPVMGDIASRMADVTIITSDNPRSEDPKSIIREVAQGFQGNSFKVIENRRDAICEGVKLARENDVLLVAGKGHEDYQIIGDKVFHFSDREVIEEYLNVVRG